MVAIQSAAQHAWPLRGHHLRSGLMLAALSIALVVSGCATAPPKRPDNACKIFKEKPSWLKHTRRAARKWRVDGAVMLAIMKQESAFDADARPPRKRFLGVPLRRPSSAFGYAQALDGTWRLYQKSARRPSARRDRFADAMDFIGWYMAQTRKRLKIARHDAYRHYLAYHDGWRGYARGTYKRKKWLLSAAKRVANQAGRYRAQLKRCGFTVT